MLPPRTGRRGGPSNPREVAVRINRTREAAFPGEPLHFEVSPDPGCPESDITWSGGGSPASGSGRRFATAFLKGGDYTVTARCGEATTEFRVAICPIDEWMERARSFFGPSIDFPKVKTRTSRLVLGPSGTAWTCNNVIRFKRPRRRDEFPRESTLIHELGHVWEHQSGQAQLLRGLVEQIGRLLGRDPYDFGGPAGVRGAGTLSAFNKESQAQIIVEYWKSKNDYDNDRKGVPFSTPGYVGDLQRLVESAGIGTKAAARRTVAGTIDAAVARFVNAVVR
jgi:hypothetical protein